MSFELRENVTQQFPLAFQEILLVPPSSTARREESLSEESLLLSYFLLLSPLFIYSM